MGAPARNERGLNESVQWAVIWPVLMLLTLGIIQIGVVLHGRNVALRAATAGVDAASGSYGTSSEAQHLAEQIASAGSLRAVSVRVTRTPSIVSVEVAGQAPVILDLGVGRVRETASAPVERVSQP